MVHPGVTELKHSRRSQSLQRRIITAMVLIGLLPLSLAFIITYLDEWLRIRKAEYVAIFVTDAQGALVVSSTPEAPYDQSQALWWKAAINGGKGQIYVSDLVFDEKLGFHVLDVAVPVLDDAQKVAVGAVNVRLRRDELFQAIQEGRIDEQGHAMLLSTAGRPLICPVLSPDKHTINASLMRQITKPTAGWVVAEDDSHGGEI